MSSLVPVPACCLRKYPLLSPHILTCSPHWSALSQLSTPRRVRVWQTVRTDAQIAAGYRVGTENHTDLNFYWQFDADSEVSSSLAVDSSGNSRSGNVGSLSTADNVMTFISGRGMQPPNVPTRLPR